MFLAREHPLYQSAQRRDDIEQKLRNYVQMTMELVDDIVKQNEHKDDKRRIAVWAAAKVAKIAEDAADFKTKQIIQEVERRGRPESAPDALHSLIASMFGINLSALGEAIAEEEKKKEQQKGAIAHPWNKKSEALGQKGAFGTVYLAEDKNEKKFALKELLGAEIQQDSLRDEIRDLKNLSHENVVKYFGCGKDSDKIYIYMELMQCSIRDKLDQQRKPFTSEIARKYTSCILAGMNYLHFKDIVHRNIKSSNVLLNSDDTPKLSDIELSRCQEQSTRSERRIEAYFWMSPEMSKGQAGSKRSDIWSLGCTVFEMVKFRPPFFSCRSLGPSVFASVIRNKIANLEQWELVRSDVEIEEKVQKFLLKIFVKMEDRPLAHEIVQHDWLDSA